MEEGNKLGHQKKPPQKSSINIESLASKLIDDLELPAIFSPDTILTTEPFLKSCLFKNLKKMERKRDWIAPLGILYTLILALTTSRFREDLGFSPKTLFIIFTIAAVGMLFWFIWCIKNALGSKEVEDIIKELRKQPLMEKIDKAKRQYNKLLKKE